MKKERAFLNILWYIENIGKEASNERLGYEFEEYAKFIADLQDEGLIKGVQILYADDTVCELRIDDISITLDGIEYLKKTNEEVQKHILEILYESRFDKSLTDGQVNKELFTHLKHNEIVAHLNILKDNGYLKVEKERIPASKGIGGYKISASTQERYRISPKGIEYVENGFLEKEKEYSPKTVWNISGGIVNFGSIQTINYIEELKAIIPEVDVREEIESYFEEIKAITAEDNVSKSKLATVFKKISGKVAEKGLDKVLDKIMDISWTFAMSQMMQYIAK